jgi:hypothetical protein
LKSARRPGELYSPGNRAGISTQDDEGYSNDEGHCLPLAGLEAEWQAFLSFDLGAVVFDRFKMLVNILQHQEAASIGGPFRSTPPGRKGSFKSVMPITVNALCGFTLPTGRRGCPVVAKQEAAMKMLNGKFGELEMTAKELDGVDGGLRNNQTWAWSDFYWGLGLSYQNSPRGMGNCKLSICNSHP